MMVRFDDETTTMQVRAPLLERVEWQATPVHAQDNYFLRMRVSSRQRRLDGSMLAFLLHDRTDANVTRVAHYNVRFEGYAN
jgi:hypothetical protein